jgi:hypothetical protein
MTVLALFNAASEPRAGDGGTLAMAEGTVTCNPWSAAAGIAQETGGRADDQTARRGARSAAGKRTAA